MSGLFSSLCFYTAGVGVAAWAAANVFVPEEVQLPLAYGAQVGQDFNEYIGSPLSANILVSLIQFTSLMQLVSTLGVLAIGSTRLGFTLLLTVGSIECLLSGMGAEAKAGELEGYFPITSSHRHYLEVQPRIALAVSVLLFLGAQFIATPPTKIARRGSWLSDFVLKSCSTMLGVAALVCFVYPRVTLTEVNREVFGEPFLSQTPLGTEMMLGLWRRIACYSFLLSQVLAALKPASFALLLLVLLQSTTLYLGIEMHDKYKPIQENRDTFAVVPAVCIVVALLAWLTIPSKGSNVSKAKKNN